LFIWKPLVQLAGVFGATIGIAGGKLEFAPAHPAGHISMKSPLEVDEELAVVVVVVVAQPGIAVCWQVPECVSALPLMTHVSVVQALLSLQSAFVVHDPFDPPSSPSWTPPPVPPFVGPVLAPPVPVAFPAPLEPLFANVAAPAPHPARARTVADKPTDPIVPIVPIFLIAL
jgi:hypothetical protein